QKCAVHLGAITIKLVHRLDPFAILRSCAFVYAVFHCNVPQAGASPESMAMHMKRTERIDSLPASCFHVAASPTPPHDSREMSRIESQHETLVAETATVAEAPPDPQLQDLVPFVAGDRIFAVFADQVDATAEGKVPVALPHAPA